nr:unnamed protein product [Spirometra erinaceieuropaei]
MRMWVGVRGNVSLKASLSNALDIHLYTSLLPSYSSSSSSPSPSSPSPSSSSSPPLLLLLLLLLLIIIIIVITIVGRIPHRARGSTGTERLKHISSRYQSGTRWCQLCNAVHSTALDVLDRAGRQHQDSFDKNDAAISNLLAENMLHRAYLDGPTDVSKAAFCKCHHLAQQRLREMQDAQMALKAELIQNYADRNETGNFFDATKVIYGSPLLNSDDSMLLAEKSQILKRWVELLRSVLNRSSTISSAAINRLPQVKIDINLDLPSSLPDTIRAVQQLSSGKASGSDGIPAEIYRHVDH